VNFSRTLRLHHDVYHRAYVDGLTWPRCSKASKS